MYPPGTQCIPACPGFYRDCRRIHCQKCRRGHIPLKGRVKRSTAIIIILLISSMLPLSCAVTRPYPRLEISMDRRVVEAVQSRSASIKTIKTSLGLRPAGLASPELSAYLVYKREGLFRLTGLTPTGFTLFNFETTDDLFTLSLPNGKQISGRDRKSV